MDDHINFSEKTLLLVNTGSNKKRFILQKLNKMGLQIVVLNKEKNWAQPYVDHWILANTDDHQESLTAVANFLREHPTIKIDGAVTFWEDDVLLTSRLTSKFNWIGSPYETVKKIRNKFEFRKFCQNNGISAPKHALIRNRKDLQRIKSEFSFPLVMKPVYGSSSAYVVKVEEEDLERVYDYIRQNLSLETESSLHDGFDIFVEEYIDGDEVDIDILMQNGKIKYYSITDNFQTEEPFFVETGEQIPSSLPENRQDALYELAEETLEKLKIQNGVVHFEAKSTKHGPVPIEVNLRMGGDEVYSFVKGAWGVDLIENAVKIAFGIYIHKINRPELPKKFICGQYFLPSQSGILSKLYLDEKLKKPKFKKVIEEFHVQKQIGDAVLVPPEGFEFIGWITVSGETQADARDNLDEVLRHTHFEISRFHPTSSIGKIERKNQFSVASTNKKVLLSKARIEKLKTISYKNQRGLNIGIACDQDNGFEEESSDPSFLIQKKLEKQGYKVSRFDLNNLQKTLFELNQKNFDFIFNLCEKIHETPLLEPHAAALFDILQIPYSGSNPYTLSLCIDKIRVKKLLNFHGIPTPKWDYAYTMEDKLTTDLKYPLIVKPSNSDNSFGITNDSVVTNPKDLKRQLREVIETYKRPALIEEYIEGDEYDVCMLGNDDEVEVLPLIRSVFDKMPKGYWHIYTSNLKEGKDEKAAGLIRVEKPAKIPKKLDNLLSEIALDVYHIVSCFDYGKVEIRVDKNGNPYVLELNPNPPLDPNGFMPLAAKLAGYSYEALIEEIILLGVNRYKDKPPFYHLQGC